MAETIPDILETYTVNDKLSLTGKFDTFAKSKGLSEKGIQITRGEIQNLFENSGKLTQAFLKTINSKIENIIRAELRAALAKESPALKGVPIEGFAENSETPAVINSTKVVDASIRGAVTGGFKKMLDERKNNIDNPTRL